MSKPRLLDLFCGAGGAAMGYHRAGFEVVGVDISPQPRYPFEFHQADALTFPTRGFDAIHASPPCQRYSVATKQNGRQGEHPDLVDATRDRLVESGWPFVIENVVGAPLREPMLLCGEQFGLGVYRHRLFECSFPTLAPRHQRHYGLTGSGHGPNPGARRRAAPKVTVVGHCFHVDKARVAMGIEWMTQRELAQAIPPAYTEYIGQFLLRAVLTTSEAT
jgi:DNA (cytosine-5)-methyltransferase 1